MSYNDKPHVTMMPMTREMVIPRETQMIGVVGDNDGERVDIDIPRWYDGIDLGTKSIYIVVSNDEDHSDMIIPDVTADDEQLHITWIVKSNHVSSEGTVYAHIRATDEDGFVWQSLDGEYHVSSVNNGPESMPDGQVTAVNQKIAEMDITQTKTLSAAAAALAAATETSPPILCDQAGMAIVATDSADRPIRGLTVYGRTVQEMPPTEDVPVEMTGAGTASPLRIVAAGKNLALLKTRQENNHGIASSYDAQTGVLTITGTATEAAYVSYYLAETIPAGVNLVIGMGNASADGNVAIRAQCETGQGGVTTLATLTGTNMVVRKTIAHAFEFIAIRVNAGTTVNMALKIGVTVGGNVSEYAWSMPADAKHAQITIPARQDALDGLLFGVPATASEATYTDEDGQSWIADTIEYDAETGTAKIIQRVASVTFDGSADEQWSDDDAKKRFAVVVSDVKPAISHGLCTHYEGLDIGSNQGAIGFSAAIEAGLIVFRPADYDAMTLEEWRARLGVSPVTVLYALSEPEEQSISAEELVGVSALRSRYPVTTVLNDAGAQMDVRYVADTKNYIDQRIEQLTNALVSTGANI